MSDDIPAALSGPGQRCPRCKRSVVWCDVSTGGRVALDVLSHADGRFVIVESRTGDSPLVRRLLPGEQLARATFAEHDEHCETKQASKRASTHSAAATRPAQRTTPSTSGGCALCGEPLVPGETVYEEVTGWAARRRAGGTNAVRVRRTTGAVACASCVDDLDRGVDPRTQGSML